jgi:hypothetical protein
MSNATEYKQAIEQAKINLADARERGTDAIGGDALELLKGLLTPEEIAASNLRVQLMTELAHTRDDEGIPQHELEPLILP